MAGNFFNGTDAQIASGSANFATRITAAPVPLGLTIGQAASYGTVNTAYQTSYTTAITPATRTEGAIAAKNAARTALKVMAADLAKIIDGNPTVTDQQKIDLGLNVRKQPTPIPAPTETPVLEVIERLGTMVRIKLHDGSGSRRGKPQGVAGASVFSFVGAQPPIDVADWRFEGNTTRTIVEIDFDPSLAPGSIVWMTAFWFNPRTQSGPGCAPVSAIIAGGAMQQAA